MFMICLGGLRQLGVLGGTPGGARRDMADAHQRQLVAPIKILGFNPFQPYRKACQDLQIANSIV